MRPLHSAHAWLAQHWAAFLDRLFGLEGDVTHFDFLVERDGGS